MSTTIDSISEFGTDNMSPSEQDLDPRAEAGIFVRPATRDDRSYLLEAFDQALRPYYGGDHVAHAERLLRTHLGGGEDRRGLLSTRQLLLVLWQDGQRVGVLNLVFKRQATCKISPLILFPSGYRNHGLGAVLLDRAMAEASMAGARQLYCTVAERNHDALTFFRQSGFMICGRSEGQYKKGETEVMLSRTLSPVTDQSGPASVISVAQVSSDQEWASVRELLLRKMSPCVRGADPRWLESLRLGAGNESGPGADRRSSWVFCARDRLGRYRAAAIGTRKKGDSVKVMPIAATDVDAFRALVIDLQALLAEKGRKAYVHLAPKPEEVAALQEAGWTFEAQLPGAYNDTTVTQQWGCPLGEDAPLKKLRIHRRFLDLIKSGAKTLEIRVGYDNVKKIRPGDELEFVSGHDRFTCHVAGVRGYPDFDEMLKHENVGNALPGLDEPTALHELRKIYPPKKEGLGVLVLELKIPTS